MEQTSQDVSSLCTVLIGYTHTIESERLTLLSESLISQSHNLKIRTFRRIRVCGRVNLKFPQGGMLA